MNDGSERRGDTVRDGKMVCSVCGQDVFDVRCYAPGKNMRPEKCRGCPQLCQGMDYGEEWVECHASPDAQRLVHF